MEVLPEHLQRRRDIDALYVRLLADIPGLKVHTNPTEDFNSNYWLTTILLDPQVIATTPDQLRQALDAADIESRLLWRPMHTQPVYKDAPYYGASVCTDTFDRGLCLPSGSSLSDDDIQRVCHDIHQAIQYRRPQD